MHNRVVSVKVKILDGGACEYTQRIERRCVGSGAGIQCTRHRAAEVLVNFQIVPDKPTHKTAIGAVEAWTGLEEQEEFVTALLQDSHDELMAS